MFANPRAMSAPDIEEEKWIHAQSRGASSSPAILSITPARQLYEAANQGDLEAVARLLDGGASPDGHVDPAFGTALHRAADHGDRAMASLLLDHGANIDARAPSLMSTPLMGAAVSGNLGMIDLLLRRGADPTRRDAEGETACA